LIDDARWISERGGGVWARGATTNSPAIWRSGAGADAVAPPERREQASINGLLCFAGMARDVISIEGLRVDCVVGVYPRERDVLQPLRIDVEMSLDTEAAAVRERLRASIDYAATAAQIRFLLQSCRFQMLETAAHALARFLLAPPAPDERRTRVESLTLRLTKPDALGGNGVPSLTVKRDRDWVTLVQEQKPFGTVDIIHESDEAGIYRLNVAPHRGIPLHVHRQMRESEMPLGDGLLVQGKPVGSGAVFRWPHDTPHRWDNPTDRWQTILCVDAPRFMPDDEIEVQGEPADIAPEELGPS
jgi:dihydroneopterin aldolase